MGLTVTAAEAAALAHVSERTVRTWLTSGRSGQPPKLRAQKRHEAGRPAAWAIDVDDLQRVPGVTVDRNRLAELEAGRSRAPGGMASRIATLERELRDVRARLHALERGGTSAPVGDDALHLEPPESPYSAIPVQRMPISAVGASSRAGAAFRTIQEAADWLDRHGVAAKTARDWLRGRDSATLTPADLLAEAITRTRTNAWRSRGRVLHQCDVEGCDCHGREELLATRAGA